MPLPIPPPITVRLLCPLLGADVARAVSARGSVSLAVPRAWRPAVERSWLAYVSAPVLLPAAMQVRTSSSGEMFVIMTKVCAHGL